MWECILETTFEGAKVRKKDVDIAKNYLNNFLNMTGREVLSGGGYISARQAKAHAYEQYERYNENRKKIEANEIELLVEEMTQLKTDEL